jgi:hypothetical protein
MLNIMKTLTRMLMVLFLSIQAQALSQDEIAQMVAKNPALLDSPQAKAYMNSHKGALPAGIKKTKKTLNPLPKVENDIEDTTIIIDDSEQKPKETLKTDDTIMIEKVKDENILHDGSLRMTPLQYKNDDEEIRRIKSIQTPRAHHKKLERFSKEFFRNKNKILQKNISVPSDYTLSRGDTLSFWIYGKTEKNFELTVNSQGNIDIQQAPFYSAEFASPHKAPLYPLR